MASGPKTARYTDWWSDLVYLGEKAGRLSLHYNSIAHPCHGDIITSAIVIRLQIICPFFQRAERTVRQSLGIKTKLVAALEQSCS